MKQVVLIGLLLSLLLPACNGPSKNKQEDAAINPDNVVLVDVDVTGMHCTDCEKTITSGISELNGIVSITADYKTGNAVVAFDSALTSISDITKVIENRGYGVAGSRIQNKEETPSE